jgi:hypothetical protein
MGYVLITGVNIKKIDIIDEMGYFAFLAGNVILSTEWSFTLIISL